MLSRRLATPCRGGNLNLPLQVTNLLSPSLSSLPEPLHRRPTVPRHQLYNALAVLLICSMLLRAEPLPARISFPPAMLYQCATVVLQCSCSSLPLQCSQFPVPSCLPACQSPSPVPACVPSSRAGPLSLLNQPGFPPTLPRLVLITPLLTLMYFLCSPSTTYRSHLSMLPSTPPSFCSLVLQFPSSLPRIPSGPNPPWCPCCPPLLTYS